MLPTSAGTCRVVCGRLGPLYSVAQGGSRWARQLVGASELLRAGGPTPAPPSLHFLPRAAGIGCFGLAAILCVARGPFQFLLLRSGCQESPWGEALEVGAAEG